MFHFHTNHTVPVEYCPALVREASPVLFLLRNKQTGSDKHKHSIVQTRGFPSRNSSKRPIQRFSQDHQPSAGILVFPVFRVLGALGRILASCSPPLVSPLGDALRLERAAFIVTSLKREISAKILQTFDKQRNALANQGLWSLVVHGS